MTKIYVGTVVYSAETTRGFHWDDEKVEVLVASARRADVTKAIKAHKLKVAEEAYECFADADDDTELRRPTLARAEQFLEDMDEDFCLWEDGGRPTWNINRVELTEA